MLHENMITEVLGDQYKHKELSLYYRNLEVSWLKNIFHALKFAFLGWILYVDC